MEHSNEELENHCNKIKEFVEDGEFGEVNTDNFEELLDQTPHKNKVWAGDAVLSTLFDSAKEKMSDDGDKEILAKLLELVKIHEREVKCPASITQDVLFFPNEDNVRVLCDYMKMAKNRLRICVFTITNNQIRNAILDAHDAGVKVEIISDDECMKAKGSDIEFLDSKGCAVRTDNSERFHMHNKFVVVDNDFVLTGSFNWTVQAAKSNQENIAALDSPYFVHEYKEEFKKLWTEFSGNEVETEAYQGKRKYNKKKANWHNNKKY
jgi:cardiolipin hydrolase